MRREHRLEVVVVSAIVLLAAFYVRAEYIPPWAERNLEIAEEKWDLPVSEVGEWFSAWTQGDGQAFAVIASGPSRTRDRRRVPRPRVSISTCRLLLAGLGGKRRPTGADSVRLGGGGWSGSHRDLDPRHLPARTTRSRRPGSWCSTPRCTSASPGTPLSRWPFCSSVWLWHRVARGRQWRLESTRPDFLLALHRDDGSLWSYGAAAAVLVAGYAIFRFGLEALLPQGARLFGLPVCGLSGDTLRWRDGRSPWWR